VSLNIYSKRLKRNNARHQQAAEPTAWHALGMEKKK
jgi:hypothetical protein